MARSKQTPTRPAKSAPVSPAPPTWDEQLINHLIPWRFELAGVLLFLLAAITLFALFGLTQARWLVIWTSLWRQMVGWGAFPLFLSLAAAGLHIALRQIERPYRLRPTQIIGSELILLTLLPLSYQLRDATLADAYQGRGGGLIGWALAAPLLDFFGPFLTSLFYLGLLTWGVMLVLGFGWDDLLLGLQQLSEQLTTWGEQIAPASPGQPVWQASAAAGRPTAVDLLPNIDETEEPELPDEAADSQDIPRRNKKLPAFALLEKDSATFLDPAEISRKKQIIERALHDFGLPATIPLSEIRQGPTVTQFGIVPGYVRKENPDGSTKEQKVRVSQIRSIQRDLALALAAPRLRVESPVPGRGVVGIEVPNDSVNVVRLRSIIQSPDYRRIKGALAVILGRDVSGNPVVIDLARLPHLLVAGTTGSGKSVCINALISCLVFNNTPDMLKLIMIDPKKVEMIRFNGLPHLIGSVEVEADRAVGVLRWLTAEMDRRYEVFTQLNVRNLASYNHKVTDQKEAAKIPYIVVFIDELGDLMHTYPGDVERTLCRLAQMARATGIHLVVATQRPSTDVITGLIKANFPARLSFSVASGVDSRVILDTVGAEQLLGKGDMLFLSPEASAASRIQGVFVSDTEIEGVVAHWQKTMPNLEPSAPPWETLIAKFALIDETDSLLEAAVDLAQKHDTISASFLQRRLRLGYPRAARLMEALYEMGLVDDPQQGGRTRRTLVDEDGHDPLDRFLSEKSL